MSENYNGWQEYPNIPSNVTAVREIGTAAREIVILFEGAYRRFDTGVWKATIELMRNLANPRSLNDLISSEVYPLEIFWTKNVSNWNLS